MKQMRDDLKGGMLATGIAAPVVIVCCGGGGVVFTAITGTAAGWIGSFGGLSTVLVAAAAALTWRSLRRFRGDCCTTGTAPVGERRQ